MAIPNLYFQFNDPVRIIWRAGTTEDPYIPRVESKRIINNKVVLEEIPSSFDKVKVSGYTEVQEDTLRRKKVLLPNEFCVNYNNGIIEFNSSEEDKTLVFEYKARGIIQYPAERIFAHNKRKNNIVENLQEILDDSMTALIDANDAIDRINAARVLAEEATLRADKATDNANIATDDAKDATKEALDAAASTIMIYLNPVAKYDDIDIQYPNPVNGDRVMVTSTGDIYRFDGIVSGQWELIDNYTGGSIPMVSDVLNGMMYKEDYTKFHTKLDRKSIVFVIPSFQDVGVMKPIIRFPLEGEIEKVYAYCNIPGLAATTQIVVEKISDADFKTNGTWSGIATMDLPNQSNSSTNEVLNNNVIDEGDYFRINLTQIDTDVKGLTIHIEVKL